MTMLTALLTLVGGMSDVGQDPESARMLAKHEAAQRGWDDDEFTCLEALWEAESGWRYDAAGSTDDHGIPQAHRPVHDLPDEFFVSPVLQIRWGLDYIHARYDGSACRAWEAWKGRGYVNQAGEHKGGWY